MHWNPEPGPQRKGRESFSEERFSRWSADDSKKTPDPVPSAFHQGNLRNCQASESCRSTRESDQHPSTNETQGAGTGSVGLSRGKGRPQRKGRESFSEERFSRWSADDSKKTPDPVPSAFHQGNLCNCQASESCRSTRESDQYPSTNETQGAGTVPLVCQQQKRPIESVPLVSGRRRDPNATVADRSGSDPEWCGSTPDRSGFVALGPGTRE